MRENDSLKRLKIINKYLIIIPIVLAATIHLWNPAGFPVLHPDESAYMIKTMRVLDGYGIQNNKTTGAFGLYAHPHFGQIFLATTLTITGYPNILNLEPSEKSIYSVYAIPRLIMGSLAVIDTFLIYQIARQRFDGSVALVASSLFAVLPATLVLRTILLDNIMLPLILSSILLALLKPNKYNYLLSGILLGLAIYTKAPAFTMIPLVGYLIFTNYKQVKSLVLWIIPVILIPCLWPVYAISVGQFDLWIESIIAQTSRQSEEDKGFLSGFRSIFNIDPVFLVIGVAGLVYIIHRRIYWLVLWLVPLLVFNHFIGWVIHFHLVPIFPVFCIAAALLIIRAPKLRLWRKIISPIIITSIICFGLVVSMLLITLNVNSYQFKAQAFVVERLSDNNTTYIGRQVYSWIPRYVYDMSFNVITRDYFIKDSLPMWNGTKVIFVDNGLSSDRKIRGATELILDYKRPHFPEHYPYTGITFTKSIGRNVDVRVSP